MRDDATQNDGVIGRLNKNSNKSNYKYNIDLNSLPEMYRGLLKNRKFVKPFVHDDKLLNILFYCLDQENDHKSYDTVYYIREIDRLVMQRNLYKLNRITYWTCSFCDSEIEIDSTKRIHYHHLLCNECKDDYNHNGVIDVRIIQNFKNYSEYINNMFKNKYKNILSKIKKHNKIKSTL